MRLTILLLSAAALAGCQAGGGGNGAAPGNASRDNTVVEIDPFANITVTLPTSEPEPDPAYVPAANDASGDNAMDDANPGQFYYRDLPAARVLRGDWTIRKVEWFAVSGSATPRRSPERVASFTGAHIRIDRQKIDVTPKGYVPMRFVVDCPGVGYLGKDALVASEQLPNRNPNITREDVLRDYDIAVAEKELAEAYPGVISTQGQILSVICQESTADERTVVWLSGVLPLERDLIALIYSDGTTLFATRDKS
jgi:hypothetical protein